MSKKTKAPINLHRLQATIGYLFSNESLLIRALSHKSIGKENNERLEFLGDSLLNFFITEALFEKFPEASEGELSRLRAHLVKGETLAEIAREFQLGEYLLLGGGELKSGGFRRDSILADTVEALIGAIYLSTGLDDCKQATLSWYESRLANITSTSVLKDAKTRLQEYLQKRKKRLPEYRVSSEDGDMHARQYTVECRIELTDEVFTAVASSKRVAEREAAGKALEYIEKVAI